MPTDAAPEATVPTAAAALAPKELTAVPAVVRPAMPVTLPAPAKMLPAFCDMELMVPCKALTALLLELVIAEPIDVSPAAVTAAPAAEPTVAPNVPDIAL